MSVCQHCWTESHRHLITHDWETVWNKTKGQDGALCKHCKTWAWASKSSVCPTQFAYEWAKASDADELERLRAIVADLAAADPMLYDLCALCDGDNPTGQPHDTSWHDPGCPWLRATQEAERA